MTKRTSRAILAATLAACGLALGACRSDRQTMTHPTTGKTAVCKECYDAVTAAHRDHPAMSTSGVQTLRTYQCPCCNTEMSVYVQDGKHMVKCAGCARDGVAWDMCAPPDGQPN